MKRLEMLLVLATGCLAVGCGKSTTMTTKDGTRVTVTKGGGSTDVTIEGKGGAKMRLDGKGDVGLPDGFPKDVPVYPGSTVTMHATVTEGIHLVLKTADPSDKVAAYYKEKLKEAGWEIEATLSGEGSSMVSGKKDQRTVVAVIGRDSGGTAVNLNIQQPGK